MVDSAQTQEPLVIQEGPRTPKILIFAFVLLLIFVAAGLGYLFWRGQLPSVFQLGRTEPTPAPTPTPKVSKVPFEFTIFFPLDREYFLNLKGIFEEAPFDSPETAVFGKVALETNVYAGFDGTVSLGGGFPVGLDYAYMELHSDNGYTLIYYFPGEINVEDGKRVKSADLVGRISGERLSFLSDRDANLVLRLLKDGERESLQIRMFSLR